MKKTQVNTAKIALLGYSAALTVMGSAVSTDAAAGYCTAGSAATAVTCAFGINSGAPWAEAWSFTGSNNITINDAVDSYSYGACASHANGTKSFGLSMEGGSMKILTGINKAPDKASGCV